MTNKQKTNEAKKWEAILNFFAQYFSSGEHIDLDAVLYLIGVRELGVGHRKFKKDEKINLIHIAVCRVLEPFGYYEFEYFDEDKWPHYRSLELLPNLSVGEQTLFMKKAIIYYFEQENILMEEFARIDKQKF